MKMSTCSHEAPSKPPFHPRAFPSRENTLIPNLALECQKMGVSSRQENNCLMDVRPVHMSTANASADETFLSLPCGESHRTITAPSTILHPILKSQLIVVMFPPLAGAIENG